MDQPAGVATDSSGNVYVSDTENDRIQKFSSTGAFITDFGGFGTGGGRLNAPRGIATDSSDNVYVADQLNNRIEKFSSGGAFIAVWGTSGTGDGQFSFPQGVAIDSSDNVYVADTENDRIQKFNSAGTFLAKWGSIGSGIGQFDFPVGIATDSSNNVYVADTFNDRIEKFNSSGNFLAQWGAFGTSDGQFDLPTAVATDSSNNVYVADTNNRRIQKFNSSGTFLTKWGTSGTGDGQFQSPFGVATHTSGNVYVADTDNHRIQKFSLSGSFTAKWGTFGTGDGQFEKPNGVAIGPSLGAAYVADTPNHRVQKLSSVGTFLTKWGSGGSGTGSFSSPADTATDAAPNVYVADTNNNRVQKFDSSGTFIATWGSAGSGDGQFQAPSSIAVSPTGNVYVADTNNNRVQWFNSSGGFLGKVSSGSAGAFSVPRGVEFDSSGNIYVADTGNHRIQKLDPSALPLIAWGSQGSGDGQFQSPWGVEVDSTGRVYVADQLNNRIQRFNSAGTFVDKFGSSGTGDGQFNSPRGLAFDSLDTLYVADTNNDRIQKFSEQPGQIVVVKNAVPNDAQNFDFTLDDDSDPALSNTKTLTVAPTSGYSVTETVPAGWVQTSATCSDGSPVSNINVSAGETVTCTFTNNKQATIIVKKDAVPDAPQDFVFAAGGGLSPTGFTLDDDSDPTFSNTRSFVNVPPGSGYSVSESVPANWTQTSATCDDGSPVSNINVSAAETVTCTFTNRSGKIVVVKDARPNDPQDFAFTAGGGLSPPSFTLDDDADPTRSNTQSFFNVAPGSGYTLAESMPTGWEEAGAICDDGSLISSINVSLGETVTCTFTNDKQGKIVVIKDAVSDDPQDFTFTAGGGLVPTSFTLDDDSDPTLLNIKTYSNVPVGSGYSISETVPAGWTQTSATCNDGSSVSNIGVSVAETVTCTFQNAEPYPHPIGASPIRATLVPAFKDCEAGSADSTHGAPLNFKSCNPPELVSDTVKMGTESIGFSQVLVCNTAATAGACNEAAPGFQSSMKPDVRLWGNGRDVQCRLTGTPTTCLAGQDYNPNGAPGPYTSGCVGGASCNGPGRMTPFCEPGAGSEAACIAGTDITATARLGQAAGSTVDPTAACAGVPPTQQAQCIADKSKFVGHGIRVTDSYNCDPGAPSGDPNDCPASAATSTRAGTLLDLQFPVAVDCLADPNVGGSTCGTNTTANALVPGVVIAGKQAVVEIGEIQNLDAGPDGVRGNAGDQVFAVQGIYIP